MVDFDNVINSSFAAKELYDKLKVKCHPDRFTDADLNKEATRLFQEIPYTSGCSALQKCFHQLRTAGISVCQGIPAGYENM